MQTHCAAWVQKAVASALDGVPAGSMVALVSARDWYEEAAAAAARHLLEGGAYGTYVALCKQCCEVKRFLEQKGIDTRKLSFIDAVTGHSGKDNCMCRKLGDMPGLMELKIALCRNAGKKPGFVIIDSLTTMALYNDDETLADFFRHLGAELEETGCSGIVLTLEDKAGINVLNRCPDVWNRIIRV